MTQDMALKKNRICGRLAPSHPIPVFERYAGMYKMTSTELASLLKATAFKKVQSMTITEEQMVAFLWIAESRGLDPFENMIMAIPDGDGGIVPYLSVDGWYVMANNHPGYDYCEFVESDQHVTMVGSIPAPAWIACTIYRNDRKGSFTVRERLAENYRESHTATEHGPWQTMPARCLRHKAFVQAARVALSPGAIYDEEEARQMAGRAANLQTTRAVTSQLNTILEQAFLHQELATPSFGFQANGSYSDLDNALTSNMDSKMSGAATEALTESG